MRNYLLLSNYVINYSFKHIYINTWEKVIENVGVIAELEKKLIAQGFFELSA